ncbi:flagellar basal body L-ring protein FlgH [Sulfurospirillum multivorans]|uniref:Flagellar L-ring protein n=2 Tax=Sulfurospirillum multivorans TaxID=66821 RepID=A0AA86ANL6_SULMK|nr:flagellar basal body L-ring protein FlgH [Sulfurospirillum multivorans]AHJ12746.1 flagellar L-ring protein FlgH [Sulfurospirillum multivorans DSM 12446]QEH06241.1 flagellar L-ring protein FlgH [Sulfurospirillum multivorans]
MRVLTCSFVAVLALAGCSAHPASPQISMKAPVYVDEIPSRVNENVTPNPGSLFGQGDNPLFADLKAMHINDVVTVTITENTAQSSTGKKTLEKENSSNLGAGITTAGGGVAGNAARQLNKVGNIGFTAGSSNSFTGSGTNTRNESFSTTISARIIKILNNGNYFIEGSRELLINGEKQMIQVSGVIRPYDIDQYNNIDSKYIAEAKILYKTEGDIDQTNTKPWGTKFMETIWPF